MTFLVDANVLSEPTKATPNPGAVQWLHTNEQDLVVDSIIVGEMLTGLLLLPRGRKRQQLEHWFANVVQSLECISWDSTVGKRWAKLVADLRAKGQTVSVLDGMLAATALTHNLTVATRNMRDFAKTGVKVVNPFV